MTLNIRKNRLKRIIVLLLMASILISTLSGCGGLSDKSLVNVSKSEEHFGTIMTISLSGKGQQHLDDIIEESFKEIERLENIFSARLTDSELSEINAKAYKEEVQISEEMYLVLKTALDFNRESAGALDVSIGKMVDMWGIGTDRERVVPETELKDLVGINGCQYVELKESSSIASNVGSGSTSKENSASARTVRFLDERVKLDLGAIAKGYAADAIKKHILNKDLTIVGILNFGGNICTIGSKEGDKPWNIGITDPFNPDSALVSFSIKDMCIVTSGNYERYFEQGGIRYHHILDANTGKPSDSGVVSVSIIGGNSMKCDALSTACFILGVDKGLALIEGLEGYEAFFINSKGEFYFTSGIDQYNFKRL